jgi:hypothetical protein
VFPKKKIGSWYVVEQFFAAFLLFLFPSFFIFLLLFGVVFLRGLKSEKNTLHGMRFPIIFAGSRYVVEQFFEILWLRFFYHFFPFL